MGAVGGGTAGAGKGFVTPTEPYGLTKVMLTSAAGLEVENVELSDTEVRNGAPFE